MKFAPWLLLVVLTLPAGLAFASPPLMTQAPSPSAREPALSVGGAIVLGIVEGATEYLPVSSTGHLILAQHALGLGGGESQAANALAICIQSGAILAVLWLYFGRFQQMLRGLVGADGDGLRLLRNLTIAFLPAAVVGLLAHHWIKEQLFSLRPVAAALFVGGLLILVLAKRVKAVSSSGMRLEELSARHALAIGLMQCLAFWPGFSRSLATILGCVGVGCGMAAAVEFSFLLGLVTLSAATVYEGLRHGGDILTHYGVLAPSIALMFAFISAVISVRFMLGVLGRFGLAPFGYYRILLAAVCLLYF